MYIFNVFYLKDVLWIAITYFYLFIISSHFGYMLYIFVIIVFFLFLKIYCNFYMMLNIFDAFIISYFLCYCLLLFIGNNFLCCCGFIVTIFADFIKFYFFVIGQIDSCMFIQVNKLALKEVKDIFN